MNRDGEILKLKIELYRDRYRANAVAKLYGVRIVRYKGKSPFGERTLIYEREGYSLEGIVKWKWFFRYLTAKYQLETPIQAVEYFTYDYPHVNENEIIRKWIINELTAAKSKLTQVESAIAKHEETKKDLFAATIDDPRYLNTLTLLEQRKEKVKELQAELAEFDQQTKLTIPIPCHT
jgi:hypothetical protein